jgi:membrane protein
MATKQQPQPSAVAQPEMPVQQPVGYPAYPQQYVYADPNKGKAKLLTLEYALAMASTVVSAFLLINVITSVVGLWSDTTSGAIRTVGGFLAPTMVTAGTGIVAASVFTVVLAVLACVLFSRVSKAVSDREGYTNRTAYKLVTYGGLAALIIPAVDLIARLVSILISSLLFIGAAGGEVYKSLYLSEFLPYALALAVVVATSYFIYQIIQGRNKSKIMSLVLIAVSVVVLLTGAITIAVKVHDKGGSSTGRSTRQGQDIPSDYESQLKKYRESLKLKQYN